MGMTDDLIKLAELKDRGVLSEEEFAKAKAQVLGNAQPAAPAAPAAAPKPAPRPAPAPTPAPPRPRPEPPVVEELSPEDKEMREAERWRATQARKASDRLAKVMGICLMLGFLIVVGMIVGWMVLNPSPTSQPVDPGPAAPAASTPEPAKVP